MKGFHWTVVLSAIGVAVVAFPLLGHAYVGPGAGITLLGSLWAVVAATFTAIGGILLWLIRALLRRRRRLKDRASESAPADEILGSATNDKCSIPDSKRH